MECSLEGKQFTVRVPGSKYLIRITVDPQRRAVVVEGAQSVQARIPMHVAPFCNDPDDLFIVRAGRVLNKIEVRIDRGLGRPWWPGAYLPKLQARVESVGWRDDEGRIIKPGIYAEVGFSCHKLRHIGRMPLIFKSQP